MKPITGLPPTASEFSSEKTRKPQLKQAHFPETIPYQQPSSLSPWLLVWMSPPCNQMQMRTFVPSSLSFLKGGQVSSETYFEGCVIPADLTVKGTDAKISWQSQTDVMYQKQDSSLVKQHYTNKVENQPVGFVDSSVEFILKVIKAINPIPPLFLEWQVDEYGRKKFTFKLG